VGEIGMTMIRRVLQFSRMDAVTPNGASLAAWGCLRCFLGRRVKN